MGICQTKKIDGILYDIISPTEVRVEAGNEKVFRNIVIPKFVKINRTQYRVTSIGSEAFDGCENLTSITIPEGVTSIGVNAFRGCSSLTSITIPEGVTSIGGFAFEDCSSLTSITIPEGVTSIGSGAFFCCSSLTSITIPEGVTSIESDAFQGCSSLTSITIPEGVTSIGVNAFRVCSSLTSINIPNSVISIERNAFEFCKSLRSIIIPNSVTFIGRLVFWGCEKLETIIVPDECNIDIPWGYGYMAINGTAFLDCDNLKSVKGHNIMYPKWIVEHLSCRNDNSMYEWAKNYKENSYNYYAYDRIIELMSEWQQKKEFETTAQWQARVTEATRAEHLKKVQKQVLAEFIEKKRPATLEGNIGSYDADYGVFPITTDDLGTFYLEVPMEDASKVKEQWSQAKVLPTYGIADDKLAIASAEVSVNGKTYKTADRYENTATDIAINLPPPANRFG